MALTSKIFLNPRPTAVKLSDIRLASQACGTSTVGLELLLSLKRPCISFRLQHHVENQLQQVTRTLFAFVIRTHQMMDGKNT
jgi:hypothetical protein